MKHIALSAMTAACLALPVHAEDKPAEDGLSLMEKGAQLFFQGVMEEMAPALREMDELSGQLEPALRGFVQNMGPTLGELLEQVEDFSKYHPPEILPNGDIILRRKLPAELDEPDGEIEL